MVQVPRWHASCLSARFMPSNGRTLLTVLVCYSCGTSGGVAICSRYPPSIPSSTQMMMIRHAFGGNLASQSLVGTLFVITTVGLGLAYYNIKMLQIDQHRAWMLRTWFYVSPSTRPRLATIVHRWLTCAHMIA
jgi:hypothetical protein